MPDPMMTDKASPVERIACGALGVSLVGIVVGVGWYLVQTLGERALIATVMVTALAGPALALMGAMGVLLVVGAVAGDIDD